MCAREFPDQLRYNESNFIAQKCYMDELSLLGFVISLAITCYFWETQLNYLTRNLLCQLIYNKRNASLCSLHDRIRNVYVSSVPMLPTDPKIIIGEVRSSISA